jgi:hypothetical protein
LFLLQVTVPPPAQEGREEEDVPNPPVFLFSSATARGSASLFYSPHRSFNLKLGFVVDGGG